MKAVLEKLFPSFNIVNSLESDYRFQIIVPKEEVAKVIATQVLTISYDNFKHSVDDPDLYQLYEKFWHLHRAYQERDLKEERFVL